MWRDELSVRSNILYFRVCIIYNDNNGKIVDEICKVERQVFFAEIWNGDVNFGAIKR